MPTSRTAARSRLAELVARLGTALGLDRPAVGLALRLALSAWLAFAIAATLHVRNAYWAAMPIWVVVQPSRGLVLERGFFRVLGTLLGAAVGIGIMHLPIGPYVRITLLSGWLALNAGLTHVLRGVHGYGALLAAITATIVVVPGLLSPDVSRDLGLARVACTLIGVVVVTLVVGLTTPGAQRGALYERVRSLSADALSRAARSLRTRDVEDDESHDDRAIVASIADLDATARLVSAGSVDGYRRIRHVEALIVGSLSVMAAAETLGSRTSKARARDAEQARRLSQLADRVRTASTDRAPLSWPAPSTNDPEVARLHQGALRIVEAASALLAPDPAADARSFERKLARLEPHREWSLAIRTGVRAGVLALVAIALAYASGSPSARIGAVGTCMIFLVLSSMAQPQRIAPELIKGLVVGVSLGTAYRFVVQPHLTSPVAIVLSIAPIMLIGGFARASRKTDLAAIDFNMGFLLASLAGMPPEHDAWKILRDSGSLLLGAALVATSFILLPRRHERLAAEATALLRTDLRRMIRTPSASNTIDWHARAGRQILRLTLHVGRGVARGASLPRGMLALLGLGHAIGDLHVVTAHSHEEGVGAGTGDAAHGGARDGDGHVDAIRDRALAILDAKLTRPREASEALRALASSTDDAALETCLSDLAGALTRAEPLLV